MSYHTCDTLIAVTWDVAYRGGLGLRLYESRCKWGPKGAFPCRQEVFTCSWAQGNTQPHYGNPLRCGGPWTLAIISCTHKQIFTLQVPITQGWKLAKVSKQPMLVWTLSLVTSIRLVGGPGFEKVGVASWHIQQPYQITIFPLRYVALLSMTTFWAIISIYVRWHLTWIFSHRGTIEIYILKF